MRAIFGVLGLLIALAVVGMLVKKQLATMRQPVPALVVPAPAGTEAASTAQPAATVREQSQQIQQQYKNALEGAMQQPRPEPDTK